jgi:hypothetical protein
LSNNFFKNITREDFKRINSKYNLTRGKNDMENNVKILVKLITENPNLKVLPMVDSELLGRECGRYTSSIGESRIDEVYFDDGKVYLKSRDEELIEEFAENIAIEYEGLEDDEVMDMATNQVEELNWETVIVLEIDT